MKCKYCGAKAIARVNGELRCEECVAYCECGQMATCKVSEDDEVFYMCDDCASQFPPICSRCDGSGLPSVGPIDSGKCPVCNGWGVTSRISPTYLDITLF